jgi:hypothetical protein
MTEPMRVGLSLRTRPRYGCSFDASVIWLKIGSSTVAIR